MLFEPLKSDTGTLTVASSIAVPFHESMPMPESIAPLDDDHSKS